MKNAIVTGATRGIGLAIATMLLEEGYFVTLTYANDEQNARKCAIELTKFQGQFEIIKVDQSDKVSLHRFTAFIRNKGHIDCLVLNAGATLRKTLQLTSDEDWEQIMMTNVNSNFYLIRDLYDMIPNNSRIIFIGSMMGIYPHGTSLAYGVTKSAVHALTLNLVKFFEETGTTINAIAPGFVETEWQKNKPLEIRKNIYQKTALHRFATVEEIADAVKFCIKNPFVNGTILEIHGGYCYK